MSTLPDWMRPPRPEGWFAEDLDRLPEAPRHTELIDGALVFMLSPQRAWHSQVVTAFTTALGRQTPDEITVTCRTAIRLDARNRLEPDVIVTTAPFAPDLTYHHPGDVRLVVEVVSPESAHRDWTVKLRKYAEAGIRHYWCVDDENRSPVVHVYELNKATSAYVPTGILRQRLNQSVPFEIALDLDAIARGQLG